MSGYRGCGRYLQSISYLLYLRVTAALEPQSRRRIVVAGYLAAVCRDGKRIRLLGFNVGEHRGGRQRYCNRSVIIFRMQRARCMPPRTATIVSDDVIGMTIIIYKYAPQYAIVGQYPWHGDNNIMCIRLLYNMYITYYIYYLSVLVHYNAIRRRTIAAEPMSLSPRRIARLSVRTIRRGTTTAAT